ncbi:hypothetical protein NDA15_006802 [Ustilago hordei]|nr:hypothetical protein NDA15_006802 [Ustilago hordei]
MGKGDGTISSHPLELVHVDLSTHFSEQTEFTCVLVAIDDASSFTYVKPLRKKSDALHVLQEWIKYAEVQTGRQLKTIRSDNGGEWCSNVAMHWQNETGFRWQKSSVYTSKQNGKAERTIRTIRNIMSSMLHTHRLPQTFWPYAIEAAAYTKNLLPNVKDQIPYQVFYNKDPRKPFRLLRTFGCLAWVNIPKVKRKKLEDSAIPAIFVGYDEEHKGWKLLSPNHNPSVFWSNSVRFLEDQCWEDRTDAMPIKETDAIFYDNTADIEDLSYSEEDEFDEELSQPLDDIYHPPSEEDLTLEGDPFSPNPSPEDPEPSEISTTPTGQASDGTTNFEHRPSREVSPMPDPKTLSRQVNEEYLDSSETLRKYQNYFNQFHSAWESRPWMHPTTVAILLRKYPRRWPDDEAIRNLQESLKERGLLVDLPNPIYQAEAQLLSPVLQPTVKQALNSKNQAHWKEAIKAEMDGLERMNIWKIVDRPPNTNLVDSKLVLTIKTDANMIPIKYKARFCARGFSQRPGVDYDEIFAPVVPQDAIRTILTIAAREDWELDSIDVTQAYLNADLHHEVFLKPPEGADVPKGKVYKLIKGLYGLKQSGREWNLELDAYLRSMGFLSLPCAPCVYLRGTGEAKVIIAVYVDDMLITGPKRSLIDTIKRSITDKWKITDNGPAKEFLKIKITRNRQSRIISLDQRAYIEGIIKEWLPGGEKSRSPMDISPPIMPPDYTPPADVKQQYPSLVGKLMWVSNTVRPDICFAVNTLARHISRPSPEAMQAALKIVKYLNQTKDEILTLGNDKADTPPIVTYTDANWASDPNTDRRSTSGSVTLIFGSLVGWKSHVQKCVSLSAVEAKFRSSIQSLSRGTFL